MRRLLLVALVLACAPLARAEDFVVYVDEQGSFAAGLPVPVEGVNAASFLVEPVANHTHLRFLVALTPDGADADAGVASVGTPFRARLTLSDPDTGATLPEGDFVLDGGGSATFVSETPLRATLWLSHGALVGWTLRVSALTDPAPI